MRDGYVGACGMGIAMKVLAYETNGEPWDVVRLVDRPRPVPALGQVVVRLEAAPLHIADLLAIRGELDFIGPGAAVPGFEGVGRIVASGTGAGLWQVGQRVILPMAYGAWQEERAVAADDLWPAPEGVAAEQLALVRINAATAYLLLHAYEPLLFGDWVIQNAANANVAHYVRLFGSTLGINVIDVVRRPELVKALSQEGRSHVLLDGPDLAERVKALGAAPKLALDAVGGAATARLGNAVKDGGLVLSYGFLAHEAYTIDWPDMMFRDVRLRGMMTDRAMAKLGAEGLAAMQQALLDLMARTGGQAEIAGSYTFAQASEALRHAAQIGSGRRGKVILRVE
jgi:NADPH:quinone reductase-like Zn-dependent oxidoreductase